MNLIILRNKLSIKVRSSNLSPKKIITDSINSTTNACIWTDIYESIQFKANQKKQFYRMKCIFNSIGMFGSPNQGQWLNSNLNKLLKNAKRQ